MDVQQETSKIFVLLGIIAVVILLFNIAPDILGSHDVSPISAAESHLPTTADVTAPLSSPPEVAGTVENSNSALTDAERKDIFATDWSERCRIDQYVNARYPVDPNATIARQNQQFAANDESWNRMYEEFESHICAEFAISEAQFLEIVAEGYDEGCYLRLPPC